MNDANGEKPGCKRLPYLAAVVGALVIAGVVIWSVQKYAEPQPLGQARAAERAKALGELRATEADALTHAAWLDQPRGVVRLPIDTAMKLVEHEWGSNPAAARSNLVARVKKANAPLPKAPEKPSAFE